MFHNNILFTYICIRNHKSITVFNFPGVCMRVWDLLASYLLRDADGPLDLLKGRPMASWGQKVLGVTTKKRYDYYYIRTWFNLVQLGNRWNKKAISPSGCTRAPNALQLVY